MAAKSRSRCRDTSVTIRRNHRSRCREIRTLAQLDAIWHLLFPGFQHLIVREFVSRVIVEPEDLVVQIDTHAVIKRVHAFLKEQAAPTLMAPKSKKRKGAFSVLKK